MLTRGGARWECQVHIDDELPPKGHHHEHSWRQGSGTGEGGLLAAAGAEAGTGTGTANANATVLGMHHSPNIEMQNK